MISMTKKNKEYDNMEEGFFYWMYVSLFTIAHLI